MVGIRSNALPPEELATMLSTLRTQEEEIQTLLTLLSNAIVENNLASAEQITGNLLDAEQLLSIQLRSLHYPIFSSANYWYERDWNSFWPVYSDFGHSLVRINGSDLQLYVYLFGWFMEPDNLKLKTNLLDAIATYRQGLVQHRIVLEKVLPYTVNVLTSPNAVILGYQLPEEIEVNSSITLMVDIANTSSNEAKNVVVIIEPSESAEIQSSPAIQLASLHAGERTKVQYQFLPKDEIGFFSIVTRVENGTGDSLIGFFQASRPEKPPVPTPMSEPLGASTGGGGFILLILGVVFVIGSAMVTIAVRNKRESTRLRSTVTPAWLWDHSRATWYPLHPITRIGRGQFNDIRIMDRTVSRRHAIISHAGDMWYVRDLDSASGTYVNNRRVQLAPLKDGDLLQFGTTRMTFRQQ